MNTIKNWQGVTSFFSLNFVNANKHKAANNNVKAKKKRYDFLRKAGDG